MGCIDHGKTGSRTGYHNVYSKGKLERAHRLAYCFARRIPIEYIKGSVVRHTCDNPRCINPRHLILGTQQDNIDDMLARQRHVAPRGVQHGCAVLTEDNVRFIRENYVRYSKEWGAVAISRMLGVTQSTVQRVVSGKTWAVE